MQEAGNQWIGPERKEPSDEVKNPFITDSVKYGSEFEINPNGPILSDDIWCSGARVRKERHQSFYTLHRSQFDLKNWPRRTNIACWHDTFPFDNVPIPLPIRINPEQDKFEVLGVFCSFACAKAYFLEHSVTLYDNQGDSLLYLSDLALKLRGYVGPLTSAPPRSKLYRFGGDLSIEQFRGNNVNTYVHFPPLIQSNMVYETRIRSQTAQSINDRLATSNSSNATETTHNESNTIDDKEERGGIRKNNEDNQVTSPVMKTKKKKKKSNVAMETYVDKCNIMGFLK